MCCLFLYGMFANHIQFLRHLVTVITFEIVVQRFAVARYRAADARCMCGEKSSNFWTFIM